MGVWIANLVTRRRNLRRASDNGERQLGTLDSLHYDFSTCLRETEVVLKSFLCALPDDELAAFPTDLEPPATVADSDPLKGSHAPPLTPAVKNALSGRY